MLRLVAFVLLFSCAPPHVVQDRGYELWAPDGDDASKPLPLLITLHGYGFTGRGNDTAFPMSGQMNAKKFRYALPDGTTDRAGKRMWNATDFCCNFENLPVDDVGFVRALVEDIKKTNAVSQVFLLGHSNGAFMSMRIACDAPELINGVVEVAGSTWKDETRCASGLKVPMLLIHGTADETILYEGDKRYPGFKETAARFAKRNGCGTKLNAVDKVDFLSIEGSETTRESMESCSRDGAVDLWTLNGAGHLPLFDQRWTVAAYDWLVEHAR
jgi:polyhydroxybutyrate depolymerase